MRTPPPVHANTAARRVRRPSRPLPIGTGPAQRLRSACLEFPRNLNGTGGPVHPPCYTPMPVSYHVNVVPSRVGDCSCGAPVKGYFSMPDYIEGKRPVIEALRIDVPLRRIFLADNAKRDPLIEDILRKARRRDVAVKMVARAKLDELSVRDSHQGVIAEARPFAYVGVGDLIDAAEKYAASHNGRALIVVLDHITDAGNFGAVIRSAESVGAIGVIIPNKRSARVDASAYKSSAGAVAHFSIAQTANIVQALKRLQDSGFWVAAASEHARDDVWDVNLSGKICLVMGNEHEGISRLVLEHCDLLGKLPQMGNVSSLNVAQASTAFMYEWLRQNRPAPGEGTAPGERAALGEEAASGKGGGAAAHVGR